MKDLADNYIRKQRTEPQWNFKESFHHFLSTYPFAVLSIYPFQYRHTPNLKAYVRRCDVYLWMKGEH